MHTYTIDKDALTVNLMRSVGIDKHQARECADVVLQMLAAPSTSHDALFDNSDAHLLNDAGDDWEAAPSTSPENADAEENVRLDAELQRCMKERDVLRTELAALRAAPSYELPFIPWSKEAEMMEAWAAPSTGPDLSRLEPFVSGLGKAILRELQQAAPSTSAEPIYQYQLANGNWIDQTKDMYDHLIKRGGATVRAVYLAAPSTSPADIAEIERLIELVKNQNAYLMVAGNQLQTALAEISALKAAPSTSADVIKDQEAVYHVCLEKWGAENGVTVDALAVLNHLKAAPSTSLDTLTAENEKLRAALAEYARAGVGNSTDWHIQLSALRMATAIKGGA